jgi:hypothetical protein
VGEDNHFSDQGTQIIMEQDDENVTPEPRYENDL